MDQFQELGVNMKELCWIVYGLCMAYIVVGGVLGLLRYL